VFVEVVNLEVMPTSIFLTDDDDDGCHYSMSNEPMSSDHSHNPKNTQYMGLCTCSKYY